MSSIEISDEVTLSFAMPDLDKEEKAAPVADLQYDKEHDDPNADLILLSNDDVHFRVHSWSMKKKR